MYTFRCCISGVGVLISMESGSIVSDYDVREALQGRLLVLLWPVSLLCCSWCCFCCLVVQHMPPRACCSTGTVELQLASAHGDDTYQIWMRVCDVVPLLATGFVTKSNTSAWIGLQNSSGWVWAPAAQRPWAYHGEMAWWCSHHVQSQYVLRIRVQVWHGKIQVATSSCLLMRGARFLVGMVF